MRRLLATLIAILVLSGCGPVISPDAQEVEIVTHCGLDFSRIEYDGRTWKFDVEDEPNPPPGWGFNTTVIRLLPGPDGPIAIGPDGSEWQLIPAVGQEGDVCF